MVAKTTGSSDDAVARKPYESPKLEVYGDIREIARSVGMTGMADGATHGQTRTS
jgi:hypothetical protein